MTRANLRMLPFLLLPLLAFICGPGYPRIDNRLERQITVSVLFSNGLSVSWEIPAGTTLHAPRDAIAIDGIEVRSEGETLFKLGKSEIEQLTEGIPSGKRVIWEIREDGVTPTVLSDAENR